MNINRLFYRNKINIAKIIMLGCIFFLSFLASNIKINALGEVTINSSTYSGNGGNTDAETINNIVYIQGSGESNHDGINFTISNMYQTLGDFSAFAVWETSFSESAGEYADYDRWYLRSTTCTRVIVFTDTALSKTYTITIKATSSNITDGTAEYELSGNSFLANGKTYTINTVSGVTTISDGVNEFTATDSSCVEFDEVYARLSNYIVTITDPTTNVTTPLVKDVENVRYYIERSNANVVTKEGDPDFVETIVDFSSFFVNGTITYTYRIRNIDYASNGNGFGFKEVYVNYWKAGDGTDDTKLTDREQVIKFGLARAISDVDSYTNHNNNVTTGGITCSAHTDTICIEYADTNSATAVTTVPTTTKVYIPTNVIYDHSYTSRLDTKNDANGYHDGNNVLEDVVNANTLYMLNYFCEGETLTLANITYDANKKHSANCSSGALRKYLYVNALLTEDANRGDITSAQEAFVNRKTNFVKNTYEVTVDIDTKGNYVVIIRDYFGNTNEVAVIKVMDILNQAVVAYYDKSNKAEIVDEEKDGWQAEEYLTNEDVKLRITMTATTVIESGLPILSATTTKLDNNLVENVYYWRVNGTNYDNDICEAEEGENADCAVKPTNQYDETDNPYGYKIVYNKTTNYTGNGFVEFVENVLVVNMPSNGRYRFFIELTNGNSTNTNQGEKKNPRVEIYKIDKQGPEILFGGASNNYCTQDGCEYSEATFVYYQGSGNESGTTISNLYDEASGTNYKIEYGTDGIYYVSANGGNPIAMSASSKSDLFYSYLLALVNSKTYIKENIAYYNGTTLVYSHSDATLTDGVRYAIDNDVFAGMSEDEYREYIVRNNIIYTAYSLATNPAFATMTGDFEENRIDIEYLDANSDTPVCEILGSFKLDLNADGTIDQTDCVNYYLDHGMDFRIKITVRDIVQDSDGNYILGNTTTEIIKVDVVDTTAPGFNTIINNYNLDTSCRIEIGNTLGVGSQTIADLLKCYGVIDTNSIYKFEDNVFAPNTQNQTINNASYVDLYILSKETGEWVSLSSGDGYTPNRSGNYAMLLIIRDAADTTTRFDLTDKAYIGTDVADGDSNIISVNGNALATVISYYVDKKLVLVKPVENEKTYGDVDPTFNYCISINENNGGVAEYLKAPFANVDSVFTEIGCTTVIENVASLEESVLERLFKGNKDVASFMGALTRQESDVYNDYHNDAISNDYVGLYKIVLGTLNIVGADTDGYDIGADYIIKVDPRVRNVDNQLVAKESADNRGSKCNLVNSQIVSGTPVTNCYSFTDDDDFFVESTITLKIKQAILTVTANGSTKEYGTVDPNYDKYNQNRISNPIEGTAAYLNGYTIEGLKTTGHYSDAYTVVLGVLRREIGENVGIYAICNFRGLTLEDTALEADNNMLIGISDVDKYGSCSAFDDYATTDLATGTYDERGILQLSTDYIKSRALYISPNKQVGYYKTLNVASSIIQRDHNYSNYIINYVGTEKFTITPATLVVQPTPGQRREYNYSGVDEVNPWELVVYGEKTFALGESFNGYTVASPVYTSGENDPQSKDTNNPAGSENYNNATEERDVWKLILAGKEYLGKKTNETYSLFNGRISLILPADVTLNSSAGVYENMKAGWYDYNSEFGVDKNTLEIITTDRNQCTYTDYKTTINGSVGCRNYDLIIDNDYRNEDGYKNGDTDASGNLVTVVYKSKLGYCTTTVLGSVSDSDVTCSNEQSTKILFEVYRREIILEFNSLLEKVPSTEVDVVYGYRYDYYYENLFEIAENSKNKNFLENSLFYCYASYEDGIVGAYGDCTNNKWYGLTEGDSWVNIGLKFKLHSIVSDTSSGYYYTDTDKAIPAGRYYVYASIEDKENYKFNYLGGTLTIKTKSVGIVMNNYQKEYGDVYYDSSCLNDGNLLILDENANLISVDGCSDYGFIIDNLDSKDTIAENFSGRPIRVSNLTKATDAEGKEYYIDTNGLQENVGVYEIGKGSVRTINSNTFQACSDNFLATDSNCVVVDGVDINNYILGEEEDYTLIYYLWKNGTVENGKDYSSEGVTSIVNTAARTITVGELKINPATITITVTEGQTKMYGCAYNKINTTSSYKYSYANGYSECVSGTGLNYDLGYEYTVSGDKDYYIYNNGYYTQDYDFTTTYTSSTINTISESNAGSLNTTSTPTGLRSSALNGGVLYRVYGTNGTYTYANLISAADSAQNQTHYQGQQIGSYIITLGNLDATLTNKFEAQYKEENNKVCNANNIPGEGNQVCKNYIISYYGNTSVDTQHTYDNTAPSFTITSRVAFIYALYNSKVYGNLDPIVTRVCDVNMIAENLCSEAGVEITYGVSYYYTKSNSLARAPWVASIDEETGISFAFNKDDAQTRNDVQTDIVSGELSRVGYQNATKATDDPVGTYNYLFNDVGRTTYGQKGYVLNFYYRTLDANNNVIVKDGAIDETVNPVILDTDNYDQYQAVDENGNNQDSEGKKVLFEIKLRKITVTMVSFSKVYGIEDDTAYFELGVCATNDQVLTYDEYGNPICAFKEGITSTEHGLSPSHSVYLNADGTLKQSEFKEAFNVTFKRLLGENVVCPTAHSAVTGTINGHFPEGATVYTYDLGCTSNGYESIGLIRQNAGDYGYNYEITYVEGVMNILPRTIRITPESAQGFQYGSYMYPTLIPSIKFETELENVSYNTSEGAQKVINYLVNSEGNSAKVVIVNRDGSVVETTTSTTYFGLVNGGLGKLCLTNIDGENEFCINDREDLYDEGETEQTLSSYTYNDSGSVTDDAPTYIFSDVYSNENSARSALNRDLIIENADGTKNVYSNQRYNRNVGVYTITKGDLEDKTGNYAIEFTENISYIITAAKVKITPNEGQNKIYGEADKELTFKVETSYTVNSDQYITYKEPLAKITDAMGNDVTFVKEDGRKIKLLSGYTVYLSGYAYYENGTNEDYNYGASKSSNKSEPSASITQSEVVGKSYDKYCYDNYTDNSTDVKGNISGCSNKEVSFSSTTLVLVGYLYVNEWSQVAGTHLIVNGFVVADNEFNNKNYEVEFVDTITFEIKKLDINVFINYVTKTYGQSTDKNKCDSGADCTSGYANLTSQDNDGILEFNFDIAYKGKNRDEIITEANYGGEAKVLMVQPINDNYYTQSGGQEDKNNYLGISVIRKKNNDSTCTIDTDKYGCEDVGVYGLALRKVSLASGIDDNYNLMTDDVNIETKEVDNDYIAIELGTNEVITDEKIYLVEGIEATLTINKRSVDIFVNTNLNSSSANYYEIEQNVEVPSLPVVDNTYNLIGYKYDSNKQYHGIGEDASSSSTSANLDSTYTKVVWGGHPNQVRTSDALVGEVAYCNEASNGNNYLTNYPNVGDACANNSKLVYQDNKSSVNTNTKDKFILITRDVTNADGLKIMSSVLADKVDNNTYESKNYEVLFYPGAVHVIGDTSDPTITIANKDYYIEANATSLGTSSNSVGTILEYLFNGTDKTYILAGVDDDGNMYILTPGGTKVVITQSSLSSVYGSASDTYPGIVSGEEQTAVRPFISNYAHMSSGEDSYVNNENIKSLESLISTLIEWFGVSSYDSGQFINGEYLERKFDKYYYLAINKNGYDIASDTNNEFAINKVGTYTVTFYVMDNSGRISEDGNTAKLHIIDTTAPDGGELTLYSAAVACDGDCNVKDKWYIADNSIRLSSFNKYSYDATNDKYYLNSDGEYIYFAEIGHDTSPYVKISDLKAESGRITTTNYIDYIKTSDKKYSAEGVVHYAWASNPSGIYLTITGGSDNSYTDFNDSENSQWSYYYSIDGGAYWIEYIVKNNMNGASATTSDGYRVIKSTAMDSGIDISKVNTVNSISYDACYQGCDDIVVVNKVSIDGSKYEFGENDISNKYFMYNSYTKCVINTLGTLITCTETTADGTTITTTKLEGNKFTYNELDYVIAGDNILSAGALDYFATLVVQYVTINGIQYRYDSSSMMLYRDHIGEIDIMDEAAGYVKLIIDGVTYEITDYRDLKLNGSVVAEVTNYSFELNGLRYRYVNATSGINYFVATTSYPIIQEEFDINGTRYNINDFDASGKLSLNGDKLSLTKTDTYENSYTLYDKYLVGLSETYTDGSGNQASESVILFRTYILSQSKRNKASVDAGSTNLELSAYLGGLEGDTYKKDEKIAYLDTTAPLIGINISDESNINANYGQDWYVYESGYYNLINLDASLTYTIRGKQYVIDKTNKKVTSGYEEYDYVETGLVDTDPSKAYMYEINYTKYYIDSEFKNVKWLNGYVEKYVGAKDVTNQAIINQSEVKYYDLNASISVGGVDYDTANEYTSITNNTKVDKVSGIGSDHYITKGKTNELLDFVSMGQRGTGIYHEDIDYIVWYYDASNNVVKADLSTQFKACYLADGIITQDCAQAAIAEVVKPSANINEDITYTINYIVRDKAGNASNYAARGVLYASIHPQTNVIINNVEATLNNSGVAATQLSEDAYLVEANQGVSLELLSSAFNINYSTALKNYNTSAVMTIYRDDELILDGVNGASFADYIDSSEIANYTIVYTMNSKHTTYLGQDIDISGKTITLHLNISSPKMEENSNITFDNAIKNESSVILISMILGFIALVAITGIVILRKRR